MKYLLRNTVLDLLLRIEKDSAFSHLLIDNEINARRVSKKDEGLLTEIVYGTLQRKITLDYYLDHFINGKKIDGWVRVLLRMSLYQMIYLDKVPDHAIIHEAVEIAKQRGHKGISSFVNGVLRNLQRNGIPDTGKMNNPAKKLSVETSHPEWLIERWLSAYGYETTKEMCEANLMKKAISIRVQPLKITREKAMQVLQEQGFEVKESSFSSQGIIVEKGNILNTELFKNGFVTIQDQSSMLVGEMLDVKPGMRVLDGCSAPGGKATHIAEKMQNEGIIQAYDLHKKKIKLINDKAEELHLSIIDANVFDARKLNEKHAPESFERILIDAPCSGLGVIRGKPEVKYHKKEMDIKRLSEIQTDILKAIAPLLTVNGLLIYSTCTVDPAENEEVVKQFLQDHPNYQIDEHFFESLPAVLQDSQGITKYGLQLFPQTYQTDGFFLTRLKKIS